MARRPDRSWTLTGKLLVLTLVLTACTPSSRVSNSSTRLPDSPTAPPTAVTSTVAATSSSTPVALDRPIRAEFAAITNPTGIVFGPDGALYVATCALPPALFKVDVSGIMTVYAGGLREFTVSNNSVLITCLMSLAFDHQGNLYVANGPYNRIQRVDTNGVITTIAGSGPPGYDTQAFSGDGGPATNARLAYPTGIAFDADDNLYIADCFNYRIRKVDKHGIITTFAGTGTQVASGDGGPAISAGLAANAGLVFDAQGNLYVSDSQNARVRRIDRHGIITTVAGNGTPGYAGDGGPATMARLGWPMELALDSEGNLYIADGSTSADPHAGNRVRKVDPSGVISTIAGTGDPGLSKNNVSALSDGIVPWGLALGANQRLYITDANNNRVRKVAAGIITTVIGGLP